MKGLIRICLPVLAGGVMVTGILGHLAVARAHAVLESSEPADGATLQRSPPVVMLTFTEEPDLFLSRIQIVDQTGQPVKHEGPSQVAVDPRTVRVPVAELPEGTYTVVWRVVSRVDGHATAGVLAFGVGVAPLEVPSRSVASVEDVSVSRFEVAGRWALMAGLVLLLGAATIGIGVLSRPSRGVLLVALAGLIGATIGLSALAEAQRAAAQEGFGVFLRTSIGQALIWRALGLAAAAIGIALALFTRWSAAGLAVAAAGAAGAIWAQVAAGHAAAGSSVRWVEVSAQWAHLAAAGVWIGGLAALLVGIRGAPDRQKGSAIRRFSKLAGVALFVVIMTGTVRAFDELDGLGDLFSTSYGQVLVVKVGGLVLLVALGAANRYRYVPRASSSLRELRRLSKVELLVAAGVLAAAALLTSLPPPTSASPARATPVDPPLELTGSDYATTMRARLSVSPAFAGTNRFDTRITDYDTGQPVAATRVGLHFTYLDEPETGVSSLELIPQRPGDYSAIGPNLALEGMWELVLTVQRADGSSEVRFHLATACRAVPLGAGRPQIYSLPLGNLGSVQGLVGGIGGDRYEVHFTFLDARQRPLEIEDLGAVKVWRPGTEPAEIRVTRLGRGHLVGHARLDRGRWYFQVSAVSSKGARLRGCFETEI